MDFVTDLPFSTDWKRDCYDATFIIVNQQTKIVHREPVKTMIDIASQAKVIIHVVVRYYGLPNQLSGTKAYCSL